MIGRTSASATGTANRTSTASQMLVDFRAPGAAAHGPVRGQIARATLHGASRPLRLAAQQRKFTAWGQAVRLIAGVSNRRIGKLQGNTNFH